MSYRSIFRPDLFRDQVVVVSGGGSGIGRCIAHELASLGAKVVLASRTLEKLEAVAGEIREDGGQADAVPCNIRDEADVVRLFERVLELHGRLDGLVNNGGGQFISPADAISAKGWKAVVETNLTGTFYMCREAKTQYMDTHGGAIVNIVADMWNGMPGMAHSGAARAGVVNLTKTLAVEWASSRVRVNAVAPGVILSSGFHNYPEPVQAMLAEVPAQVPLARFGTESEVSAAVAFLLSEAAAFVSGETLRVDGAQSLYRHVYELPSGRPSTKAYRGFHRKVDAPSHLLGEE